MLDQLENSGQPDGFLVRAVPSSAHHDTNFASLYAGNPYGSQPMATIGLDPTLWG
jgi:hypothetical protein